MLTSRPLLNAVLRSRAAASLGCLSSQKNPHDWLASRLKAAVDSDRGTVTLRLVDCPRKDAVALLTAAVEAYKAEVLGAGREGAKLREREALVQLLQMNQQANVWGAPAVGAFQLVGTTTFVTAGAGPSKAEADASVLQAPCVVQPGLPGKEGPAR
jgi:hypothetical protein